MMLQFWCLNPMIAFVLSPQCYTFFPLFPYFATISLLKYFNKTYISFSGGKDSTVLLHLVRRIYPNTVALFVNTGLEYPEINQFVKSIDNVTTYRPEMSFRNVIENYGYPVVSKTVSKLIKDGRKAIENGNEEKSYALKQLNGNYINVHTGQLSLFNYSKWKYLLDAPFKISFQCCDVMKKRTAHKFEKETGLKPFIGTMASESELRKTQWLYNGCNAFKGRISSKPLSFWTEQDILQYIKKYELPYATIYGDIVKDERGIYKTTGAHRTGCIYCMFGCHLDKEPNRFQQLKQTHPNLWEYCMKDWDKGGLGMKEVLNYINVKSE